MIKKILFLTIFVFNLLIVNAISINIDSESEFNKGEYLCTYFGYSENLIDSPGYELPNFENITSYFNMTDNVLLYHLNNDSSYGEDNSLVYDFSGNGLNGTITGAVYDTSEKYIGDSSLYFDGSSNDRVSLGSNTDLLRGVSKVTVSTWINLDSTASDYVILEISQGTATGSRFELATIGDDIRLGGRDIDGSTWYYKTAENVLSTNTWYHITGVIEYDTSDIRIYLNGSEQSATGSVSFGDSTSDTSPQVVYVGLNGDGSNNDFNGNIDELALWERELSDTEIEDLYKYQKDKYENVSSVKINTSCKFEFDNNQEKDIFDMTDNVLLYHLNNDSSYGENSSHIYDFSGNENNGTINGNVNWNSTGNIEGAFDFDGSDGHINAGEFLNKTGPITISAWIYPRTDGESDRGYIVSKDIDSFGDEGYFFFLIDSTNPESNSLTFFKEGGTDLKRSTADDTVSYNEWQHVAVTWDGSTSADNISIYKNGVELTDYNAKQDGVSLREPVSGMPIVIGNRQDNGRTFDGLIDEIAIWNRSLSATEVLDIYNKQSGKYGEYITKIYDTGSSSSNISNLAYNGTNGNNFSIKTSYDNNSWTDWIDVSGNPTGEINSSTRFFQFKTELNSSNEYLSSINITYDPCSPLSLKSWQIYGNVTCDTTNRSSQKLTINDQGKLILKSSVLTIDGLEINKTGESIFIDYFSRLQIS